MTREEFTNVLDNYGYSYEIEGDRIIVTYRGSVFLESLTSLPPGVVFKKGGVVRLDYLTSLPPGVEFRNRGYVGLKSLTSIPPGVAFGNDGIVNLQSLTSIHPVVEFNNEGNVWLGDIIGGFFNIWKGNIEGIDSKMLLNVMIKQGVFER